MPVTTISQAVEGTILLFTVEQTNYTITNNGSGTYTIVDNVGSERAPDTLTSMEFAKFSNATVTLATGAALSNSGDSYFEPDLARSYKPVVRGET